MTRAITFLRFLRLPLVWTAVGDSLAGAAIALAIVRSDSLLSVGSVWPLAAAVGVVSAALYLLGMGLNDLADMEADRAAGRRRPLATGDMLPRPAIGALVLLLGLVLMAAAFLPPAAQWATLSTLICIVIYDLAAKRWPPTAIVFMSLCRVLNGLIGFAAIGSYEAFNYFRAADHDCHRHGCDHYSIPLPVAWLLGLALLTALASGVSQWEKSSRGRPTLAGRRVDFWIMNSLLGLSVVNALAVTWAWQSAWGLAWLLVIPLVKLTGWAMRRAG